MDYHKLTIADHIATIKLNHPPLNITPLAMVKELQTLLNEVLDNEDVRVIILTSNIEGIFGAGIDLNEMLEQSPQVFRETIDNMLNIMLRFIKSDKVSIAAINGNAIGSAADLTLGCDIRIMGSDYYLNWPEAYLGLMPIWGANTLLPMLVGRSHALEWLLTGRKIYTAELQESGLLHGVIAHDELMDRAMEEAQQIAKTNQNSVKHIKSNIQTAFYMPLQYAFISDAQASVDLFSDSSNVEAIKAFLVELGGE